MVPTISSRYGMTLMHAVEQLAKPHSHPLRETRFLYIIRVGTISKMAIWGPLKTQIKTRPDSMK